MPVNSGRNAADSFVEIWDYNLETVFDRMRELAVDYRYIAMDTEYPGVVCRPFGEFKSPQDYQYHILKANVDILRIIQLGITFFDDQGNKPPGVHTFQINFKFCMASEPYAHDSIELLCNAGIHFDEHEKQGCEPVHFAELLISSGLVLTNEVRWISFQGSYDFGYLIKLLTNTKLPEEEVDFMDLYRLYFPATYDVKYLMKSVKQLKGGLQEVSTALELERVGPQHQAGSDSLLTGQSFFKMKEMYFDDKIDDQKYCGFVMGLGNPLMNGSLPQGAMSDGISDRP